MCAASPHGATRLPPDKRLHSAFRWGGWIKCNRGGLPAGLFVWFARTPNCGSQPAGDDGLTADLILCCITPNVGAAEGCDLLISLVKNKIKRSQPRCTRQLLQRSAHASRVRPAGRPPRGAVAVFAPSRGRVEVLRSGQPGKDAGLAAPGHGWPMAAGPRSRTGARACRA
ncbi:hypothetical protein D3C81_1234410 [compost metagenome]